MSYSNYDPDDPQHRFHTQPTTPFPQPATPYTEPAAPYAQPAAPYPQPATPYAQPAAPYPQPATPYAQPAAPYPQPATPYAQPPASYPQPAAPYAPPTYAPPTHPAPPAAQPRNQTDTATIVARVVVGLTGGVAFIFALHIFFSLANANQDNGFVQFVYVLAKVFVLGFGDVFTPDDATIGLVLNYSLAALVYLVIGKVIARALRQ